MPVPSQGRYGFHSFPVVDWFCPFIYLRVLSSVILLLPLYELIPNYYTANKRPVLDPFLFPYQYSGKDRGV
jgi:hypothetical protein